jgi:hypothetical protein
MKLIRLYIYEQPISFARFAAEGLTLAALIGCVTGFVIAITVMLLQ